MKIMWVGVPPWMGTGYGTQAAVWCKRMADAGHEVLVSSVAGCEATDGEWHGIPVLGSTRHKEAEPMILNRRLQSFQPDVVMILADHRHMLRPEMFRQYQTVAFIAGDCDKLSAGDSEFLKLSGAQPWAISRHMQRILDDAGYDAPYVPHAIECDVWKPAADRAALRAEIGIQPEDFCVGLLARNIDPRRKAIPEQMKAFARFRVKHPKARMFLHTLVYEQGSNRLDTVAENLGLTHPALTWTDQPALYLEQFPQDLVVKLAQCMDVVMNCSLGEGFGLHAIEAQACGTPVILADNSTGPELVGPGWLVPCDDDAWIAVHEAWQAKPLQKGMAAALEKAAAVSMKAAQRGADHTASVKRAAARQFALQYDVESVWPLFEKALAELTA